jgi:hypothetical protein
MTAPDPKAGNQQSEPNRVDPRDALNAFVNKCEDLADELVRLKPIDPHWHLLHRLVDSAWAYALGRGLPQIFGADLIQQIMADAFRRARNQIEREHSPPPRWSAADITGCRGDDPTPQATIDAIIVALQQHGMAALEQDETIARLQLCNDAAKQQINAFIEQMVSK